MSRSRNWVFTLNNPPERLTMPGIGKYLVYQLEQGESGTPHYQGFIQFRNAVSLPRVRRWLSTAHWEPMEGTPTQARAYCMKDDTRLDGPWETGTFTDNQGQRLDLEAVKDAIRTGASREDVLENFSEIYAKYPVFVHEYLRTHSVRKRKTLTDWELKEWQKILWEILDGPPQERAIYWVYDPVGGHGKTWLANLLVQEKGAFYCNGGKHADILHAYGGEDVVVFDYVREAKDYVAYGPMEQLKNGLFFSPKYNSAMKRFEIPHVIVFANFEIDDSKLSKDRIYRFSLTEDGYFFCQRPMDSYAKRLI